MSDGRENREPRADKIELPACHLSFCEKLGYYKVRLDYNMSLLSLMNDELPRMGSKELDVFSVQLSAMSIKINKKGEIREKKQK